MEQEHLSDSKTDLGPSRSARWLARIVLLLAGAVVGITGYLSWASWQERQHFQAARQKTEALFRSLSPQTEAKLELLARQIEDLQTDLAQAQAAASADAIALSQYRAQQKRLQLQAGQVEQSLKKITMFAEQAPQHYGLRAGREILSADEQEKVTGMQAQLDFVRQEMNSVVADMDAAKEHRQRLLSAETEAIRRTQAETEAAQRVQTETLLIRAQAEALRAAQSEARASLQPSALSVPNYVRAADFVPTAPLVQQVLQVQPAVSYANAPLVIGSSYPDRYLGYRSCYRYSYPYSPYSPGWFRGHPYGRASWCR